MQYIDLTHTFTNDMPVFPGDPKATLEQVAHIAKDTFNDHRLTTVMHVGTHMDAPLHMIDGGQRIDELAPERFFGRGVLLDVRGKKVIDASALENVDIQAGDIILLFTGYGTRYHDTDYFSAPPPVTTAFAEVAVKSGVKMLGMDMSGPDWSEDWVVHKILLGNGVLILENLTNLDQLLGQADFEVIALPAKLQADGAPVRVIARLAA